MSIGYRNDFPIFKNNPDLIYLDSTASSQKPQIVIDGIKDYLENSYSNIGRGAYEISEISEKLYIDSKKKVADFIGAKNPKEIIYTYNSTYALNLLSSSLGFSKILQKGDKVLLSIAEHNANILPWELLREQVGIEIDFIKIDENYNLDLEDFNNKYDKKVKIISLTQVSNVTGQIFDLEKIGKLKREDTIFIVDASQSIPHFKIDVTKINCDYLFFTGHKIMADSGIGVLWGKKENLDKLNTSFAGGGSNKFEPGTPNITGAVSLLKALEYIENIGGYEVLEKYEESLVKYFLEKLNNFNNIKIIGTKNIQNRIGVFSMIINEYHSNDIADMLADKNIAVRSGKHCAHKLFGELGFSHSFRVSLYIYNTKEDIDMLFKNIEEIILTK